MLRTDHNVVRICLMAILISSTVSGVTTMVRSVCVVSMSVGLIYLGVSQCSTRMFETLREFIALLIYRCVKEK